MRDKAPKTDKPIAVWSEKEFLNTDQLDALVVILRGRGCYWSAKSGCIMCGYSNDTTSGITEDDLQAQFVSAMDKYKGEGYVKIYTSGSFFDNREMTDDTREKILVMAGDGGKNHVLVESRPEFITADIIDRALEHVSSLEVAIGLETANDDVRKKCVNKGFTFANFERAATILKEKGVKVRTYILLKPPYLTERQAIEDAVDSAVKADALSDTISFNPINVQRWTLVEELWKKGLYRPPWLWSLAEVLKRTVEVTNSRIVSSPSGGGSRRGVHNCKKCNKQFLEAVDRFYMTQDPSQLEFSCTCKAEWLDTLDFQEMMGTTGDVSKLLGIWE